MYLGFLRPISLPRTSQLSNSPLPLLFDFATGNQRHRDLGKDIKRFISVQFADIKALVLFLQIGKRNRESNLEQDKNHKGALFFCDTGDNKCVEKRVGDLLDVCIIVKIYKKHYITTKNMH